MGFEFQSQINMDSCGIIQTCDTHLLARDAQFRQASASEHMQSRIHKKVHKK